MVNKDGQLLQEAYLSALQKSINVPSKIEHRQPDSTNKTETLEDKMQGVPPNLPPTPPTEVAKFNDVVSSIIQPEIQTSTAEGGCGCENETEEKHMTKANLFTIYKSAKAIYDIMEAGHTLDYWMCQKLAVCAEHLTNIFNVVEYEYSEKECSSPSVQINVSAP